jgi:hypothetical protein
LRSRPSGLTLELPSFERMLYGDSDNESDDDDDDESDESCYSYNLYVRALMTSGGHKSGVKTLYGNSLETRVRGVLNTLGYLGTKKRLDEINNIHRAAQDGTLKLHALREILNVRCGACGCAPRNCGHVMSIGGTFRVEIGETCVAKIRALVKLYRHVNQKQDGIEHMHECERLLYELEETVEVGRGSRAPKAIKLDME